MSYEGTETMGKEKRLVGGEKMLEQIYTEKQRFRESERDRGRDTNWSQNFLKGSGPNLVYLSLTITSLFFFFLR